MDFFTQLWEGCSHRSLSCSLKHCFRARSERLRCAILYCFDSAVFRGFGVGLGGDWLATSSVSILVVDDFEPWRQQVCSMLHTGLELRVIAEAADGLEAVQKAAELKPDLILLDIGLPTLNGIEAARQIRKLAPDSKIVFLTQESSPDVVEEAFLLGARGYIVKTMAGIELLSAVEAVLEGKQFLGSGLRLVLEQRSESQAPSSLEPI